VTRTVHNDCAIIPLEVPGVVGVSAVGNDQQDPSGYLKSFYSSFGVGATNVTAPGGDSVFGHTAAAVNGRVLSTWPPNIPCTRKVTESLGDALEPTTVCCYLQGTSMASPHVAGVEALIISQFGKMAPSRVTAYLDSTADPQPCPASLPVGRRHVPRPRRSQSSDLRGRAELQLVVRQRRGERLQGRHP
jgi:subtilisin family serine protease